MFRCHWALIGLSKVYFFGIPEDYLLACSIVPALYIFFREYIRSNEVGKGYGEAEIREKILRPKIQQVYGKTQLQFPKRKLTGLQKLYFSFCIAWKCFSTVRRPLSAA